MTRILDLIVILSKYAIIFLHRKYSKRRAVKPQLVKSFFEEMGGSFIKFGQLLALRVDILPKEYSLAMIDLLDNVKPFSYKEVGSIISYELGAKPTEIFTEFDKTPFASASFGQVHAAKLSDKEIVAVKILRPGIEKQIAVDFILIDILAFIADLFFKIDAMPWSEFAAEFKKWTLKELNYYIEGENNDKFYKFYTTVSDRDIVIPRMYPKLSTKRVLVQEYIDGIPLSRILRGIKNGKLGEKEFKKLGINIKKIPKTLVYEILRQYFYFGLYHADPHPGNILILKDNKIALIDFGIIGEADEDNKDDYIKFLTYVGKYNFKDSAYHFGRITGKPLRQLIESVFPATMNDEYVEGFIKLCSDYFTDISEERITTSRKDLADMKTDYTTVFLQVVKSAKILKARLPTRTIAYLRALSMLGLLAKELDFEFRLTTEINAFFEKNPYEKLADRITPTYTKRINREKAMELLNNWLTMLFENKPDLYQLVNNYIKSYNK